MFPGPPTIYHALLQLPESRRESLRSLRLAVTGAAAVPVDLLRRMSEELGLDVVLTAYGLTETIGLVTLGKGSVREALRLRPSAFRGDAQSGGRAEGD